jgi:hypothetical protein
MAKKKKEKLATDAEKIKAELDALKEKKKKLDKKEKSQKKAIKKTPAKAKKKKPTITKKTPPTPAEKRKIATAKKAEAKKKAAEKKVEAKKKAAEKKVEAKRKAEEAKKKEEEAKKKEEEAKRTLEEELEEQLSEEEIENFQIEKVDMEKLTNKICEVIAKYESEGMLQSELWKKLKLSSRDGSRLALRLERRGTINREKILEKGRWTYKLILKKTPISTLSMENAPCLICPVEQKCSIDGEISPRTCQWIEEWVLTEIKKPKKEQ